MPKRNENDIDPKLCLAHAKKVRKTLDKVRSLSLELDTLVDDECFFHVLTSHPYPIKKSSAKKSLSRGSK
jgi:hypothetical protein